MLKKIALCLSLLPLFANAYYLEGQIGAAFIDAKATNTQGLSLEKEQFIAGANLGIDFWVLDTVAIGYEIGIHKLAKISSTQNGSFVYSFDQKAALSIMAIAEFKPLSTYSVFIKAGPAAVYGKSESTLQAAQSTVGAQLQAAIGVAAYITPNVACTATLTHLFGDQITLNNAPPTKPKLQSTNLSLGLRLSV